MDNLNQEFNNFRLKGNNNQYIQNQTGNTNIVSNTKYNIQNSNNDPMEPNYNTINYYNLSSPNFDKNPQNYSDQDDVIGMMQNLNLGSNNNIFNPGFPGGPLKQFEGEDDVPLNFDQDLNQINQGNNNQINFMNNQNMKKGNKNKKK